MSEGKFCNPLSSPMARFGVVTTAAMLELTSGCFSNDSSATGLPAQDAGGAGGGDSDRHQQEWAKGGVGSLTASADDSVPADMPVYADGTYWRTEPSPPFTAPPLGCSWVYPPPPEHGHPDTIPTSTLTPGAITATTGWAEDGKKQLQFDVAESPDVPPHREAIDLPPALTIHQRAGTDTYDPMERTIDSSTDLILDWPDGGQGQVYVRFDVTAFGVYGSLIPVSLAILTCRFDAKAHVATIPADVLRELRDTVMDPTPGETITTNVEVGVENFRAVHFGHWRLTMDVAAGVSFPAGQELAGKLRFF